LDANPQRKPKQIGNSSVLDCVSGRCGVQPIVSVWAENKATDPSEAVAGVEKNRIETLRGGAANLPSYPSVDTGSLPSVANLCEYSTVSEVLECRVRLRRGFSTLPLLFVPAKPMPQNLQRRGVRLLPERIRVLGGPLAPAGTRAAWKANGLELLLLLVI